MLKNNLALNGEDRMGNRGGVQKAINYDSDTMCPAKVKDDAGYGAI